MPRNNRKLYTVTRSISFRFETLAAVDRKVLKNRDWDRSSYVNGILEHVLGIYPHPEYIGRTVQFIEDKDREWEADAKRLERESNPAPAVLVRRPGRKLVK